MVVDERIFVTSGGLRNCKWRRRPEIITVLSSTADKEMCTCCDCSLLYLIKLWIYLHYKKPTCAWYLLLPDSTYSATRLLLQMEYYLFGIVSDLISSHFIGQISRAQLLDLDGRRWHWKTLRRTSKMRGQELYILTHIYLRILVVNTRWGKYKKSCRRRFKKCNLIWLDKWF